MRWAGHAACMGETRNEYSIFVRNPEAKRQFGRQQYRWEDNIKFELMEIGFRFIQLKKVTGGGNL
jgi:hypothetical protein